MANYPLSHITVGGNTYDIEHATILTCTIDQSDFSGGAYLADAWFKGAADDLTVLSYSGKTLTDAYDDLVAGHPVYLKIIVNNNTTDIIPLSVDSGGWQKIFYGVVSTTGHIYSFKVFDAAMMDDFPTKISKTADSASGGGGGGGSTLVLRPFNLSMYDYCNFADATSGTISFQDSTQNDLNFSDIATAFESGRVILKDTTNSFATIVALNTSNNSIVFEYISSSNLTKVRATDQYDSATWQCTSIS